MEIENNDYFVTCDLVACSLEEYLTTANQSGAKVFTGYVFFVVQVRSSIISNG